MHWCLLVYYIWGQMSINITKIIILAAAISCITCTSDLVSPTNQPEKSNLTGDSVISRDLLPFSSLMLGRCPFMRNTDIRVLMQQFAQKAAEYYECAEIVEYHHEQKVDHPSGTAVKTAQLMAAGGKVFNQDTRDQVANIEGSRGAEFNGIRLHAIRLPGFIASQEVILGSAGERLTIRHDSIDRNSYMAGIFRAANYITNNAQLIYGLEKIL